VRKNFSVAFSWPILICLLVTFMHLADAFIQSDLQCIQAIHFLSVCSPSHGFLEGCSKEQLLKVAEYYKKVI